MNSAGKKKRAPRNRTLELSPEEARRLGKTLLRPKGGAIEEPVDALIAGEASETLPLLPRKSYDLLFADPPYNLTKNFGKTAFKEVALEEYERLLDDWLSLAIPLLKPTASVYICGDWRSSAAIQNVGSKYLTLRNRITWEREKGRGSKSNWKNSSEDIWFFTVSDEYTFHTDAVKLKRRVLAPYTEDGRPKDWQDEPEGRFRLTHPSNIWTDITVPFWSMPENTDHPTQKPEKLLAKLILASTNRNEIILDPFLGSGTSAVTARKLGRRFTGIEIDENYLLLAAKRLEIAEREPGIQGFEEGVFWERNTKP